MVPSLLVPVTESMVIVGAVSSIQVSLFGSPVMREYPAAHADTTLLASVVHVYVAPPSAFATAVHASHVFGVAPELKNPSAHADTTLSASVVHV